MVSAVLFDVVGTLLHLREPVGRTYARLARDFGIERNEASLQRAFRAAFADMPPMVFPNLARAETAERERLWWRDLVERTFRATGVGAAGFGGDAHRSRAAAHGGRPRNGRFTDFETFFTLLFDHFAGMQAWVCAPGTHEVLALLRERGLRTGIVSNFDLRLPALLGALGLQPLLDVVVLPADVGAAKPDARIFALALERIGLPAARVLYVGDDADADIRAAAACGIRALDVTRLGDLRSILQWIDAQEHAARGVIP